MHFPTDRTAHTAAVDGPIVDANRKITHTMFNGKIKFEFKIETKITPPPHEISLKNATPV